MKRPTPAAEETTTMADVYRRYAYGQLRLKEAVALLRGLAHSGKREVATLSMDAWPPARRDKAERLLNRVIEPSCKRLVAGLSTPEEAVREIVPFFLPHGVFAINLGLPNDAAGSKRLERFFSHMIAAVEGAEAPAVPTRRRRT